MNAVKTEKKVQRVSTKRLGIRELKGSDKMTFSLDSLIKREIVFKPV